jgi:hypothetical protein
MGDIVRSFDGSETVESSIGNFGDSMSLLFFFLACTDEEVSGKLPIDVVNDIPPVSTAFTQMGSLFPELAGLSPAAMRDRITRDYPNLEEGVTYYLRRLGKLTPDKRVESVTFFFGSLKDIQAESGDGERYTGYIDNQLLANVKIQGVDEPMVVIVQCLNGTFLLPGQLLSSTLYVWGDSPVEEFTIARGEGLAHHVPYQVAIDLAEEHGLSLFRGKEALTSNQLTAQEARGMERNTDQVQVTVRVYEGDRFDLVNGTYTPHGG